MSLKKIAKHLDTAEVKELRDIIGNTDSQQSKIEALLLLIWIELRKINDNTKNKAAVKAANK
jgi:hypothetical protein